MDKIRTCNIGDKVIMALRLQNIQIKKTTSNADYASMVGFDTELLIDVKVWNLPEEKKEILKAGEVYIVEGAIKDYQGKKQLNATDFRLAKSDEVNLEEFFEYAPLSKNDLQAKISSYIARIDNELLQTIVLKVIKKYASEFFDYPAAVTVHHNYISGLAYHTYSMLILSDVYLKQYPFFNKNLVYAGIILHDIGKVKEFSGSKGTVYTKEGNLLGHISIGANMVANVCAELGCEDSDEALSLLHIILSHHGELEYGSPKEPMIAEAALINILDFSDSRFASLTKFMSETSEGEYTDSIMAFDRRSFYVPKIK